MRYDDLGYAEQTISSESRLKRFSHASRFDIAVRLMSLKGGERVLDFGTGDGHMIKLLAAASDLHQIVGYEPRSEPFDELKRSVAGLDCSVVSITSSLDEVMSTTYDQVCCLEVLEHMTTSNQRRILNVIRSVLNVNGRVLISVPVEVGPGGLLKNLARIALHQTHDNTTVTNVLKSLFCIPIKRADAEFIPSHIGFNYHDLQRTIIECGYKIDRRVFSPFPKLGGLVASQVFFSLRAAALETQGR